AFAMAKAVRAARLAAPPGEPTRTVLRPRPVDEVAFAVERTTDGFVVRGERPERWVRMTNFDNDEAVGYLADRLARLGIEDELCRQGAEPGVAVTIGDWTFDWAPPEADAPPDPDAPPHADASPDADAPAAALASRGAAPSSDGHRARALGPRGTDPRVGR
ncbi:MAG: Obg family GTPase CgtA, partial [Frankia sp.]|nr:Obg family GTPase CgtA [Frankia sp.]